MGNVFIEKVEDIITFKEQYTGTISSNLTKRNFKNCSFKYQLGHNKLSYPKTYENMLEEPKIYIHDEFMEGNQKADLEDGKLIDLPNLINLPLFNTFEEFLQKAYYKDNLYGVNKPSYKDKKGNITNKNLINYWHYHIGPYDYISSNYVNKLEDANWDGSKSGPVLHYLFENNVIILVAFAIEHSENKKIPNDKGFKQKSKIIEKL